MDKDLKIQNVKTESRVRLGQISELVFDDQPLDPLLAGIESSDPSPASVIEVWKAGVDRSDTCLAALIAVLAKADCRDNKAFEGHLDGVEEILLDKIALISEKSDLECVRYYLALARVLRVKDRLYETEPYYRKALAIQERLLARDDNETRNTLQELIAILCILNREEESRYLINRYRNRVQARSLAGKHDASSLLRSRRLALEMVYAGQFIEAEKFYLDLLENGYELPGTYCHLIRVYLMMDREDEAFEKIDQAWMLQNEAPEYVRVRILFFRILLHMMIGEEWQSHLGVLKQAMDNQEAYMHWEMKPVLDRLKPRLREEEYNLMSAIVSVLADYSQKGILGFIRLWESG